MPGRKTRGGRVVSKPRRYARGMKPKVRRRYARGMKPRRRR